MFDVRPVPAKSVDADVVATFSDGKKTISPKGGYEGLIDRLKKAETLGTKAGAVQFVRFGGRKPAESVLVVSLGNASELTHEKARIAGGKVYAKLSAEKAKSVTVQADLFAGPKGDLDTLALLGAFAEGLILPAYSFAKYKSAKADAPAGLGRITFVTKDKKLTAELTHNLKYIHAMGEAVTIVRDWSNEPSNFGTPEYYAGEAKRIAKSYGIKCTVLSEKECARQGMGLFLGVGAGSDREGQMIVLEYTPKKVAKDAKTIAFVGKGITFDTGGISLKPGLKMEEMKHDMTGAATMFGATLLASRMGVKNKIVTVLAFTENMPGGDAITPSHVLKSRSGKTVEIWNTDAEGRLVLGDALDLAQDYKPDVVVDAATLTGAVGIALGKLCAGLMANDDALAAQIKQIGDDLGERLWQLPAYDEYFEDLKSDVADMKNVANDGMGGTIRGGMFLKQFIKKGVKWAHLDIAYTSSGISHLAYMPKTGASGQHVRTLAKFANDFS